MDGVRINSTVDVGLHARAAALAQKTGRTLGAITAYGLLLACRAIEQKPSLAKRLKTDARKDRT